MLSTKDPVFFWIFWSKTARNKKIFTNFPPNLWKNTNGLKFCHWKIHFLGVQSHSSPKVLSHRIFSSPNAPFKIWAVYPCFTRWYDVSLSPLWNTGMRIFRKKQKFLLFWSKFMHFPSFSWCFGPFGQDFLLFLLKVLLMPENKWGQKKKKKKKGIDHFQEPFATRHDVLLSTSTPLLSHTKNRWRDDWPYWPQSFFQLALTLTNT